MTDKTSFLVAALGKKQGVLAQCFAHTAIEAERAVEAMAMDSLGGNFTCKAIDDDAKPGVWIEGDAAYIASIIAA